VLAGGAPAAQNHEDSADTHESVDYAFNGGPVAKEQAYDVPVGASQCNESPVEGSHKDQRVGHLVKTATSFPSSHRMKVKDKRYRVIIPETFKMGSSHGRLILTFF
jgi:hypothetical protein